MPLLGLAQIFKALVQTVLQEAHLQLIQEHVAPVLQGHMPQVDLFALNVGQGHIHQQMALWCVLLV
jgi:hypothetical protein